MKLKIAGLAILAELLAFIISLPLLFWTSLHFLWEDQCLANKDCDASATLSLVITNLSFCFLTVSIGYLLIRLFTKYRQNLLFISGFFVLILAPLVAWSATSYWSLIALALPITSGYLVFALSEYEYSNLSKRQQARLKSGLVLSSRKGRVLLMAMVIGVGIISFQKLQQNLDEINNIDALQSNSIKQNKAIEVRAYKSNDPDLCDQMKGESYAYKTQDGVTGAFLIFDDEARQICRTNIKNHTPPYRTEIR